MLKNISLKKIKEDDKIKSKFINAKFNDLNINCNILSSDFYCDSFNYFPITEESNVFLELFSRDLTTNNNHFLGKNFYSSFLKKKENFKNFSNIFLLGLNAGNNYYSNLIHFLPRLFFNNKKDIKVGIHRNSSLKLRNFIELILKTQSVKFSFVYLDDDFYAFKNSQIPQFLNLSNSVNILRKFLKPKINTKYDKKIYVTRESSFYRKIVNESDIIPILRAEGYKIINPELYDIDEQINIFGNADKIVAPHGSNLANIVFCKPETEVIEIAPEFIKENEKLFEERYNILSNLNNLKYKKIITDTVEVTKHSNLALKFISKQVINNSNYYKNLIVKIKKFKEII